MSAVDEQPSRVTRPRGGWPAALGRRRTRRRGDAAACRPRWATTPGRGRCGGASSRTSTSATTAGPSFKPLPVLALAPLSVLGAATPAVWMGLMRAAAVLSLPARLPGRRPPGRAAGGGGRRAEPRAERRPLPHRAAGLRRAGAHRAHARRRRPPPGRAPRLGARAHRGGRADPARGMGPARAYGVFVWLREPGLRPLAVAAVVLPPALWLGLDWIGSGDPLHASSTATSATEGSAANAKVPAFEVVRRAADAVIVPTLILAGGRGRARGAPPRSPGAVARRLALGWIAVVAIMAEVGFTGTRRYLAAPAAALCVVAGVGSCGCSARSASAVRGSHWGARSPSWRSCPRCCAPARTRACSASRAARPTSATSCARAVARVGGRAAVLRPGRPAINPWLQTALAWELDVPLSGVQATWSSSRRHPHWAPPALVFRAPARLAGPRPALPRGVRADVVTRSGRWRVLRAGVSPHRRYRGAGWSSSTTAPTSSCARTPSGGGSSCSPSPTTRRSSTRRAEDPAPALRLGHARVVGARRRLGRRSTSPTCSSASPS